MQFPDNYFDDEVRDGFLVSGIIKKSWAAQLEVLSDIDTLCRKHGIRWFADCGTLLGAVTLIYVCLEMITINLLR